MAIFVFSTKKPTGIAASMNEKLKNVALVGGLLSVDLRFVTIRVRLTGASRFGRTGILLKRCVPTDRASLPLEFQFLGKQALAIAAGHGLPGMQRHFTIKRKPKSAALRLVSMPPMVLRCWDGVRKGLKSSVIRPCDSGLSIWTFFTGRCQGGTATEIGRYEEILGPRRRNRSPRSQKQEFQREVEKRPRRVADQEIGDRRFLQVTHKYDIYS